MLFQNVIQPMSNFQETRRTLRLSSRLLPNYDYLMSDIHGLRWDKLWIRKFGKLCPRTASDRTSLDSFLPCLDRFRHLRVATRPRVDDRHLQVVEDLEQLRKADIAGLPDLGADFWKFQNDRWKYRQKNKTQYFGFLKYRTFKGSFSAVSKPNVASKY